MLNKSINTLVLFIFVLAFALPVQVRAEKELTTFAIRGKVSGSFEEAPQNIQAVLHALIAALRGEFRSDQFGPVIFESDNLLLVRKAEGTFYAGFDVKSIQISYINKQAENTLQLVGRILWEDLNQRRAATAFTLTFEARQKFILIKEAKVTRMPPNKPRVITFLVLEKKVRKKLKVAKEGYLPLLELVSKNSISPDNPPFFSRGKQDYLLFTFSLDRLAKGGRIDYIISNDTLETDIRPKYQKLINYSGWQVLVLASRFNLREKKPPEYRVFYTPAPEHPKLERKPYLVTSFRLTNNK